jgi:hypothetical protein
MTRAELAESLLAEREQHVRSQDFDLHRQLYRALCDLLTAARELDRGYRIPHFEARLEAAKVAIAAAEWAALQ